MNKFPLTLNLVPTNVNVVKTSDGDFNPANGGARSIVGKRYDLEKKCWNELESEEVLCVNNLALNYYKTRVREGALKPADEKTASLLS